MNIETAMAESVTEMITAHCWQCEKHPVSDFDELCEECKVTRAEALQEVDR